MDSATLLSAMTLPIHLGHFRVAFSNGDNRCFSRSEAKRFLVG